MKLPVMYPWTRYLATARKMIYVAQLTSTPRSRSICCPVPKPRQAVSLLCVSTTHQLMNQANMSLCRQNYPEECEAGVNRQINLELYASYVYLSMAFHFNRDDVALPGFYKFFLKLSHEEKRHAEKLMKYQNLRGGKVALQDIKKPEVDNWGSGLDAMMSALKLEMHVNQSLLDLHQIAESKNDAQFEDFLEDEFLREQVESIKEISDYVTQLNRAGPGLGEYLFDKETLQEHKKS